MEGVVGTPDRERGLGKTCVCVCVFLLQGKKGKEKQEVCSKKEGDNGQGLHGGIIMA